MSTVKHFKDAGLVFVEGDLFMSLSPALGVIDKDEDILVTGFAWRENTGKDVWFNGLIEYETVGHDGEFGYVEGGVYSLPTYAIQFDTMVSSGVFQIARWRPALIQPDPNLSDVNAEVFADENGRAVWIVSQKNHSCK